MLQMESESRSDGLRHTDDPVYRGLAKNGESMTTDHPSPSVQWTFRRVMGATLVLVLVALGFWLLYRFHQVVLISFIAILMGTVIRPVVTWLHRRGLPRTAGVMLVYLLLLALLIGFVLLLFPLEQPSGI